MENLFRIVYVSTAVPGLDARDIERLLNISQSNNDERFITGYLVHNGTSFMQLIEGPFDEVDEIYARILQDRRHTGVVRIQAEWTDARVFPNWSMNYFRVDRHDGIGAMVARAGDSMDSLMEAGVPRDVLHLFSRFIQQADYPDAEQVPGSEPGGPSAGSLSGRQQDPLA